MPLHFDHSRGYQTQSPPAPATWCGFNNDTAPNTLANQDCWEFVFGTRDDLTSDLTHPMISRSDGQSPLGYTLEPRPNHWFGTAAPDYNTTPWEVQDPHKAQLISSQSRISTSTPPPAQHYESEVGNFGPKKRRMDSDLTNVKPSGACTRCKRLKMKCSFPDTLTTCARCLVGGHECVVLGRKPRSPGAGEILRKRIRQKDAEIDDLLNQLNPTPSLATPLAIVPSKLALTETQRATYKAALSWLEKPQGASKGQGDSRTKVDISTLDDSDMDTDEEGYDEQLESPIEMGPLLGRFAPASLLIRTAIESVTRRPESIKPVDAITGGDRAMDRSIEAGVGSRDYFQPGPATNLNLRRLIIERQAAPDILLSGLITFADAEKLFEIFFKWINPFIPVLDENIHTASAVLGRCPFLFTVVCALSSRYVPEKPELFGLSMHLAKAAAASNFLDGWKTLEMCQAYLLLGAYSPPARRWEEDRTWFYTGLAFRLAIELNLSRIPNERPSNERVERELLNKLRTWIICYVMDRITCTNLGKPFMMPEDDIIQNAETHFLGSTYQRSGDAYLVCLVELLRIMTRFVEKIQPMFVSLERDTRSELELLATQKLVTDEFVAWKNKAMKLCDMDSSEEPSCRVQLTLLESVHQFCCLVTLSSGLQFTLKREMKDSDGFIIGSLNAATEVLKLMLERLLPSGYLPYCPEQVFVFTAFAAASLMKLLRPEFSAKITPTRRAEAVELLKRLNTSLDDEKGDGDVQEARQRYADFLRYILKPHLLDSGANVPKNSSEMGGPTFGESPRTFGDRQTFVVAPTQTSGYPQYMAEPRSMSSNGRWDTHHATPYDSSSSYGHPAPDYLSSMMASTTQFWFQ